MGRPKIDRAEAIRLRKVERLSYRAIAEKFGATKEAVRLSLKEAGEDGRLPGGKINERLPRSDRRAVPEEVALRIREGETVKDVALDLGVTDDTIYDALDKANVEMSRKLTPERKRKAAALLLKGMKQVDVARKVGIAQSSVSNIWQALQAEKEDA